VFPFVVVTVTVPVSVPSATFPNTVARRGPVSRPNVPSVLVPVANSVHPAGVFGVSLLVAPVVTCSSRYWSAVIPVGYATAIDEEPLIMVPIAPNVTVPNASATDAPTGVSM